MTEHAVTGEGGSGYWRCSCICGWTWQGDKEDVHLAAAKHMEDARKVHDVDCGYTVTGRICNCSCPAGEEPLDDCASNRKAGEAT